MKDKKIQNKEGEEDGQLKIEEQDEEKDMEYPAENVVNIPFESGRAIQLIQSIENDLRALKQLIGLESLGLENHNETYEYQEENSSSYFITKQSEEDDGAINGVFDGERMIDASGKIYQVPANYASKSKLVEGDPLKLYITSDGKYLYKQVGPIARRSVRGILRLEGNHYVVDADDGETYNILTASVTYFMSLYNLQPDDAVIILVPMERPSRWAVIDNIA